MSAMQHQAYASTFRPAGSNGYDGSSTSTATNQHSNASNPAGTTAPVSMTFPWSSDETALAVFQRLQAATMVQALSIHLTMSRLELVRFHDQYEVIACTSEVSEFVLSASIEIAQQLHDNSVIRSHILHISTGDTWFTSLAESGLDLSETPLWSWHQEERVKSTTVSHLQQLYHVFEYLRTNFHPQEQLIMLIEGSIPLFLAEKPTALGSVDNRVPHLVERTMNSLTALLECFPVMCFWINSSSPSAVAAAGSGGGGGGGGGDATGHRGSYWREAHPKDAMASFWRKRVPQVLFYAPQQP